MGGVPQRTDERARNEETAPSGGFAEKHSGDRDRDAALAARRKSLVFLSMRIERERGRWTKSVRTEERGNQRQESVGETGARRRRRRRRQRHRPSREVGHSGDRSETSREGGGGEDGECCGDGKGGGGAFENAGERLTRGEEDDGDERRRARRAGRRRSGGLGRDVPVLLTVSSPTAPARRTDAPRRTPTGNTPTKALSAATPA